MTDPKATSPELEQIRALGRIEGKIDGMISYVKSHDDRMDKQDVRMDKQDEKVDKIDTRLRKIENQTAKSAAISGAVAAIGTALAVEMMKRNF